VRVPGLVNWGTPAYRGGLEEGDLITAADGKAIATLDDWQAAVRAHKPGDTMPVEFSRHGSVVKAAITVEEDPTVEVVTLESTGGTLSAEQKAMRDGWLGSKRKS
jgi:predicted metalloprotease with PDZ domain